MLPAKIFGILTLIWFYTSAKKSGGPGVQWAVIGVIGYWLTWWLSKMLIVESLAGVVTPHSFMEVLLTQSPVACSVLVCFFIRKKLIASVVSSQ
jgi:hypothetical protein